MVAEARPIATLRRHYREKALPPECTGSTLLPRCDRSGPLIRQAGTPAWAALVANPARNEWPEYLAGSSPAAATLSRTTSDTVAALDGWLAAAGVTKGNVLAPFMNLQLIANPASSPAVNDLVRDSIAENTRKALGSRSHSLTAARSISRRDCLPGRRWVCSVTPTLADRG
jgi:hypothetical protein